MTFLDMWITNGGNNDTGFSNAQYDILISQAKVETDVVKRENLLREAEDILMDEMPVIFYFTKFNNMHLMSLVNGINLKKCFFLDNILINALIF